MLIVGKVRDLLSSVRFWIVTLTAIISYLQGIDPLVVFQTWSAVVVGIGSVDSVAERLAGTRVTPSSVETLKTIKK